MGDGMTGFVVEMVCSRRGISVRIQSCLCFLTGGVSEALRPRVVWMGWMRRDRRLGVRTAAVVGGSLGGRPGSDLVLPLLVPHHKVFLDDESCGRVSPTAGGGVERLWLLGVAFIGAGLALAGPVLGCMGIQMPRARDGSSALAAAF